MDFARNLPCIRKEAPGEVPVNVKVLNSHVYFKKYKVMRKFLMKMIFRQNILITMQCQESHLRVQYQTG